MGALGLLKLQKDNGVCFSLDGPLGKELVLYDFSSVALHTVSYFLSTRGVCSEVLFDFE